MKLWPAAQVRPLRFHDLRHTTASLLIMAAPTWRRCSGSCGTRTRVSRWSSTPTSRRTTCGTRSTASRSPRPSPRPTPNRSQPRRPPTRRLTLMTASSLLHPCCSLSKPAISSRAASTKTRQPSPTWNGAGYRARTGDIQLGKDQVAITAVSSLYQPSEETRIPSGVGFQPTQALAANRRNFAAGLLLEPGFAAGTSDEPLLSVAEVAQRLAVSTATVYGLCGSGKLTHARLLNVIRVRPEDLRTFIDTATITGLSRR
jgi:excisionase family DNA binding protein